MFEKSLSHCLIYCLIGAAAVSLPALACASDVNFGNTTNPFEIIGQQHNDGLDYLAANKQRLAREAAFMALGASHLLAEYQCSAGRRDTNRRSSDESCRGRSLQAFVAIAGWYSLTTEESYRKAALDDTQIELLTAINNAVAKYASEPQQAILTIKHIEARARALPKRQGGIVLVAAAVARYSVVYWHDAFAEQDVQWGIVPAGFNDVAPDKFCRPCLVEADMRGAVVGYHLGGTGAAASAAGLFSFLELSYEAGWW